MNHNYEADNLKVALLWRGDPDKVETPTLQNNRLYPLFNVFAEMNVTAEPLPYADDAVDQVRSLLLRVDGVLVWVDPVTEYGDRSKLDPMLREIAARGVWVSAHPDVIQKIGTKEVLFHTRHLGWGVDTHLYNTEEQFRKEFPSSLKSNCPRVVKQRRGNGGIGTWRVELVRQDANLRVHVQEARRGSTEEDLPLIEFLDRCSQYFSASGCIIDQPLQQRIGEGMIRCYLVHDQVAGFSTQMPRAAGDFVMAREKTMYTEQESRFARLRAAMESDWVPELRRLFSIEPNSLPAIWDADFMLGPKDPRGDDSYVLGEINVSAVFPFPDSAIERIALATITCLAESRKQRHQ